MWSPLLLLAVFDEFCRGDYIAADWYIKAGNQLRENGDRDAALRAMEKALNLVPDHPQAMRLREALLR